MPLSPPPRSLQIVSLLLEDGRVDPMYLAGNGRSVLTIAALEGHAMVVERLLKVTHSAMA